VHTVLAKSGIPVTRSDIFGPRGGIWLDGLVLPEPYAGKVVSLRALMAVLEREITRPEQPAVAMLAGDRGYAPIRELPGIGPTQGAAIVAEIGEVTRFGTPTLRCQRSTDYSRVCRYRRGSGWPARSPAPRSPHHQLAH
jgi:hypothetical protein